MWEDFPNKELAAIEAATRDIGRTLFARLSQQQSHVWERRWWEEQVLAWAMHDEQVKVQLFRFIDVLPALRESASVVRHLNEYLADVRERLPRALQLGAQLATPHSLLGRAVALAARRNALGHARQFIAGSNVKKVLAAAVRQRKQKRAFTLDVLGEAVVTPAEADRYLGQYLQLVREVAPVARAWPEIPQIDRAGTQVLPRCNLSVKLSALDPHFDAIDPAGTTRRVAGRLRELFRAAQAEGAFIHVDMESYALKSLTLQIFQAVLEEPEFRAWPDVGIVIQTYLREAQADLAALAAWAQRRGAPVTVRLVKGAYWDYETVLAAQHGWPAPVFQHKWESDANFERCARFLLRQRKHLRPALASHNLRSLAHGLATARHLSLAPHELEVQMLYGMADAEKQALTDLGYRLRIYMPYGELIPGMAYLVRRLLENTSNDSFLRASFTEHLSPETLLMNPLDAAEVSHSAAARPAAPAAGPLRPTIVNEPPADFAQAEQRAQMVAALQRVRGELGRHYRLQIGREAIDTPERIESVNPAKFSEVIGTSASATAEHVDQAVALARAALPRWQALGAARRADYLRKLAAALRKQRFEFAAWLVLEAGKTWREADAEVCEAIDFCVYYAEQGERLGAPRGADLPGEENRFYYAPRGVCGVIAPWNFPLAILTGMTVAALVTGNTVVLKPAEQTPVVAARLVALTHAIDLPEGVLSYLPGAGEVAGAALVKHPQVALIVFTGSREVGLSINRTAAELSGSSAPFVKRVIAEMGGKNAILVDDDADLDEAVLGILHSAFGFGGQKCSACSRVIALSAVHDPLVQRLVDAARDLQVGPPEEPGTQLGPLIDAQAKARVEEYIEHGKRSGRLLLGGPAGKLQERGYFVRPHVFVDMPPEARCAQEEIFGPVLVVLRAHDFDEAVRLFNDTPYALTGGVYSRSPAHLERARHELQAGNLYLNRGITGALVGRQPFGGFKLSGIGSQAGGPDYLLQFVVPRTVTENTMRRGFTPAQEST